MPLNRSHTILFCLCIAFLPCFSGFAQSPELVWWNPAQSGFTVVEGQAWPSELKNPYDRLPARAEKTVRTDVWNLSHQTAGLMIRFRASTSQLVVRYVISGMHAMQHMPATGVSGIDLYALNSDGDWRWCTARYTSVGDTITYRFSSLEPSDEYKKGFEYRLYLPLYTAVQWMTIGVPKEATFSPLPVRPEKPLVVYGTSIAQGACASRPGMAWTSILGRQLDLPLINLGFSGNGKLEKEMIDLLVEMDAKLYVLDCLPNLTTDANVTADEVYRRILESVQHIRQKRPTVPILLVEHAGYTDELINPVSRRSYTEVNEVMRRAFVQLKTMGFRAIYRLSKEEIDLGMDSMVDGVHPTDLGMQRYAEAYEKIIREILLEPLGKYATTQPRTQYRDASWYDWETRHKEVLALNREKAPKIIFLGNSITHYWGGQPKGPIARGNDSWNAVLEPLGARNLGFGYDRIENVLWRVYHGELDGYSAAQVVLMIGTNNLSINSDTEIVEGLKFLIQAIQTRQPTADILLVGLLPRRNHEERIARLNQQLAYASAATNASYTDAGNILLGKEGKIEESLFEDGLHPNAEGYRRFVQQLKPYLKPPKQPKK
jgi:lysophospholipase L1-like esterase